MSQEATHSTEHSSSSAPPSAGHEGISFGSHPATASGSTKPTGETGSSPTSFLTPARIIIVVVVILGISGFLYWRAAMAEKHQEYTVAAAKEQQTRNEAEQLAQQVQRLDAVQQKSLSPKDESAEPPVGGGISLPSHRPATRSVPDITDTIGEPRVTNATSKPAGDDPVDSPLFAGTPPPAPTGDPSLMVRDTPPPTGASVASSAPAPSSQPPSVAYRGKSISMLAGLRESAKPLPSSPVTSAPAAAPLAAATPPPSSPASFPVSESLTRQVSKKPPFGAYIPVRLLGAFSTTAHDPTQSYLRFETVRDVVGPNWRVLRGSQWIGQLDPQTFASMRNGNSPRPPDRLSVRFIGYIDPVEQKLVPVGGEVHGEDGNPGLKAERKRVDSRWTYALARTLGIGLDILYQRLATPAWILPNVGDLNILLPVPTGRPGGFIGGGFGGGFGGGPGSANLLIPPNPQYMLRVSANQMAYVLVNELPPAIDGRQIQMVETVLQPSFSPFPGGGMSGGMGGAMPGGNWPGPGTAMGGFPAGADTQLPFSPTPGSSGVSPSGNPPTGRSMPQNTNPWTPGMPADPAAQREYLELLQMLQSLP